STSRYGMSARCSACRCAERSRTTTIHEALPARAKSQRADASRFDPAVPRRSPSGCTLMPSCVVTFCESPRGARPVTLTPAQCTRPSPRAPCARNIVRANTPAWITPFKIARSFDGLAPAGPFSPAKTLTLVNAMQPLAYETDSPDYIEKLGRYEILRLIAI